ncbi:MAG: hypothetical protein EBS30_18270, partial [Planctomycetes bacterium]|nr:hypothetical protein [Planctomycetota bacterium]
ITSTGSGSTFELAVNKASIGGLTSGNIYYVIKISDTSIKLAASMMDASATTPVVINLSSVGTGAVDTFTSAREVIDLTSVAVGSVNTFKTQDFVGGKPKYLWDSGQATYNPDYQYRLLVGITGMDSNNDTLSYGKYSVSGLTGNTITTSKDHGLTTGDRVVYQPASGTAAISGLTAGATYFVIVINPGEFQLASSVTNSINGIAITLSGSLTGNHAFVDPSQTHGYVTGNTVTYQALGIIATALNNDNKTITTSMAHGLATGDRLVYQPASGTTAISGLMAGSTYFVIVTGSNQFQLASSAINANSGTAISLSGSLTGTHAFVDPFQTHGYVTGDTVAYQTLALGGLTNGATYTVEVVDANTIKLKAAGVVVNLTGTFAGSHQLVNDINQYNKLKSRFQMSEAELGFSIGGGLFTATRTTSGTEVRVESANVRAGGKITLLAEGAGGFI